MTSLGAICPIEPANNSQDEWAMKRIDAAPETAMKELQRIFRKRGSKALEMTRKEILSEKIESKEAREALKYFITKLWQDRSRPSLMSIVCEAAGGDPEQTTSIAISLSLTSGAMDVHDDIIDQSRSKYGHATVYGKYGKDIALLVGDALLFKGLTLLNRAMEINISSEKKRTILDIIRNMFFELGDAEAIELEFRGKLDVSPDRYLRVLRKKAADVEAHTRISAILACAKSQQIEALGEYGRVLGMLILLRDDWIDIYDVDECLRRIRKEALPLPLLYGLHDAKIRDELKSILLRNRITKKEAELISKSIQGSGIPKKYASLMRGLADKALIELEKASVKNRNLEIAVRAALI